MRISSVKLRKYTAWSPDISSEWNSEILFPRHLEISSLNMINLGGKPVVEKNRFLKQWWHLYDLFPLVMMKKCVQFCWKWARSLRVCQNMGNDKQRGTLIHDFHVEIPPNWSLTHHQKLYLCLPLRWPPSPLNKWQHNELFPVRKTGYTVERCQMRMKSQGQYTLRTCISQRIVSGKPEPKHMDAKAKTVFTDFWNIMLKAD